MDWTQFINFGVSFVILLGIALFVNNKVWPYYTKRIERTDTERKEQLDQFIKTLTELNINLRVNTETTLQTLQEVRKIALDREKEQSRTQSRQQRGPRE